MKPGEQYECDHLPGKTLTIVKMYGPRMASIRAEDSEKTIMCKHDLHEEPRLMLAHIGKEKVILRKKEAHLW